MEENTRISIRPILDLGQTVDDTDLLVFQNQTLRPILKMQHIHLGMLAQKLMPKISSIDEDLDRRIFCQNFLNKNPLVTNFLTGIIVGMFTETEMGFYIGNNIKLNKRIKEMMIVRIADAVVN
jgi:hypothetical protein